MKTGSVFILIILSFIGFSFNQKTIQNEEEFKDVLLNGAVFRWKIKNNEMVCELKAPTSGWVSAGFKSTSGIVQSNLIMGSFDNGIATCEDHTVIDVNNYVPVEDLGGSNALNACDVIESDGSRRFFWFTRQRIRWIPL